MRLLSYALNRRAAISAAALFVLGACVLMPRTAAHADVKIVAVNTLTGLEELGAHGVPTTEVSYYKGDKYRNELQGRSIVHIYDCATDRYYTLNRTDMTYMVQHLDEAMREGQSDFLAKLSFKGKAEITEGGSTKNIAGRNAKNYAITTVTEVSSSRTATPLLNVKIEGEEWSATALTFPSKCPGIAKLAYMIAPRASKLLEAYYEKLGHIKGVPLSMDIVITLTGAVDGTFEAHSDVTSISTAKIPDYMFTVPKGYRLVDKIVNED